MEHYVRHSVPSTISTSELEDAVHEKANKTCEEHAHKPIRSEYGINGPAVGTLVATRSGTRYEVTDRGWRRVTPMRK